jgi:hypothetical protein
MRGRLPTRTNCGSQGASLTKVDSFARGNPTDAKGFVRRRGRGRYKIFVRSFNGNRFAERPAADSPFLCEGAHELSELPVEALAQGGEPTCPFIRISLRGAVLK